MSQNIDFKLTVPIVKSESESGWYIRGIAAGIETDKQDDALLPQAIAMLADQINNGSIPFRNQHNVDTITEDIGTVTKATVLSGHRLEVEVALDPDNPDAQYLWKKLDQGKQFGFSIKGHVVGDYYVADPRTGKRTRKIPFALVDEISATTRPVFSPSLGTVIKKAMDAADATLAAEGEPMSTQNGDTAPETTTSAPETVVAQEQTLTPSQVIVADLIANSDFKLLMKSLVAEHNTPVVDQAEPTTEETTTSDDSTEVPATDFAEIVKSAVEAVGADFNAKLQAVLDRIPENSAPSVLVKSEEETVKDALDSMDAFEKLRVGLAARHGELTKVR